MVTSRCAPFSSLAEIIALCLNDAPFNVAAVKILADPLPGIPLPQIVLSETGRPATELPIRWDVGALGEEIRTVRHHSRQGQIEALGAVQALLRTANLVQQVADGSVVVAMP